MHVKYNIKHDKSDNITFCCQWGYILILIRLYQLVVNQSNSIVSQFVNITRISNLSLTAKQVVRTALSLRVISFGEHRVERRNFSQSAASCPNLVRHWATDDNNSIQKVSIYRFLIVLQIESSPPIRRPFHWHNIVNYTPDLGFATKPHRYLFGELS